MKRLFWMWQTGFNVFAILLIVLLVVIFVKGFQLFVLSFSKKKGFLICFTPSFIFYGSPYFILGGWNSSQNDWSNFNLSFGFWANFLWYPKDFGSTQRQSQRMKTRLRSLWVVKLCFFTHLAFYLFF